MQRKELVLDLAKLVIAAAWSDGELCNDEVNALKDLLFGVEDVSADDWTVLSMYMESPATEGEREALLERVLGALRTKDDKAFALASLESMFACDGKVTSEEQQLMDTLQGSINSHATTVFSSLSRAFKSAIGKRRSAVQATCLREAEAADYVENTIYYLLKRKAAEAGIAVDLEDAKLRKLCLASGLLARIAGIDEDIAPDEREAMRGILAADWALSPELAALVVDISCDRTTKGLDGFRLSFGYFECTTIPERQAFLRTLFKVANAANKTDNDEIEEIRRVATGLKLPHKDFIDAKLTISREDRNGL